MKKKETIHSLYLLIHKEKMEEWVNNSFTLINKKNPSRKRDFLLVRLTKLGLACKITIQSCLDCVSNHPGIFKFYKEAEDPMTSPNGSEG